MSTPAVDPSLAADLEAWPVLRPVLDAGPYLPWSSWSLRPAAMVQLCNEVVIGRRRRVVECGSGVSTVVLARLFRQLGRPGTVTSLEHDAGWAALITEFLDREGLADVATVLVGPLEGDPPWYAAEAVDRLPHDVDLLVVDGPPAFAPGHGRRRAPALARLQDRLVQDATVILDDALRPGEQAVLAEWNALSPWHFLADERTGTAAGRRDPAQADGSSPAVRA